MDNKFLKNLKAKKDAVMSTAMITAASAGVPVHATDLEINSVNVNSINGDPTAIIGKALGMVYLFSKWIGAFLVIWGAFMLFNSMKSDEAESKSRAIMTLGAGVGLIALETIVKSVLGG